MSSLTTKSPPEVFVEKITLIIIIGIAFFFRVYELPTHLFTSETHSFYPGLRLHVLDWLNFWDHMSQNFFKVLFGSPSMRFPVTSYVSSTIFTWLNIPINEYSIRFFSVCLGTLSVVGIYFLGRQVYDYRLGLIGAFIFAINPFQIFYGRSEAAEETVTFVFLIFMLVFFRYKEHPTWIWRTAFSLILPLVASFESVTLLPLVVLYQVILFVPPEPSYSKKIIGCFRYLFSKENILLWLPCVSMVFVHIYVFTRIGMSKIGLFGNMVSRSQSEYSLSKFWEGLIFNIDRSSTYFVSPWFFYSSLAIFFYLIFFGKKYKLSDPLIFLGLGLLYILILISLNGANSGHPHYYMSDSLNFLFFGLIWVSLAETLADNRKKFFWGKGRALVFYGLSLFLVMQTVIEYKVIVQRQHLIHPFKSIGYYIHQYGGGSPTVYLFLDCRQSTYMTNAEFYFGTQVIDMEERFNAPRQLFCMASNSIPEILSAYKLKDFDFYVALHGYSAVDMPREKHRYNAEYTKNISPYVNLQSPKMDSQIQEFLSKGGKRVAIIRNKGAVMGEIYSHRDLPFMDMELDKYDSLWDQKYGNIAGVVKTSWMGTSTYWGTLWDPVTGIQYQAGYRD